MTPETVTIILPLPHGCLSPNRPTGSFGGRMRRANMARKHRRLAREAVEDQHIDDTPWQLATVSAIFFHPTHRRRDDVNSLAMLKSVYDGAVDAGLLVDDDSTHLKTIGASFAISKDAPRVELTFTRLA